MKHYELLCVLPGTLSEDEVAPVMQKVQDILEKQEATEIVIEDRGKSRMAYPMKHIRYGYFRLCTFKVEPGKMPVIQEKLRLVGELMRALITVFDPSKREEGSSKEAFCTIDEIDTTKKTGQGRRKEERKETAPAKAVAKEKVEEKKEEKKETVEKPKEEKNTKAPSISMEDIDKNLDEILESDIAKV